MTLADEVPLSLLTMVIGAVLGSIIIPFGQVVTDRFLERKRRPSGLTTAFLLFFAANGVWIIAEIFVELFVRLDENRVAWPTATPVVILLGLAALIFAVGFKDVSTLSGESRANSSRMVQALKFLILGNIFWILGEAFETFAWELWPDQTRLFIYPATWLRLPFLLAAVSVFVAGIRAVWRAPSPEQS